MTERASYFDGEQAVIVMGVNPPHLGMCPKASCRQPIVQVHFSREGTGARCAGRHSFTNPRLVRDIRALTPAAPR